MIPEIRAKRQMNSFLATEILDLWNILNFLIFRAFKFLYETFSHSHFFGVLSLKWSYIEVSVSIYYKI